MRTLALWLLFAPVLGAQSAPSAPVSAPASASAPAAPRSAPAGAPARTAPVVWDLEMPPEVRDKQPSQHGEEQIEVVAPAQAPAIERMTMKIRFFKVNDAAGKPKFDAETKLCFEFAKRPAGPLAITVEHRQAPVDFTVTDASLHPVEDAPGRVAACFPAMTLTLPKFWKRVVVK